MNNILHNFKSKIGHLGRVQKSANKKSKVAERTDILINITFDELKKPKDVVTSIQHLIEENSILKKEIEKYQNEKVELIKEQLKSKISHQDEINVLVEKIDGVTADGLKKIQFDLKNEIETLVFGAVSEINGKPFISIIINDEVSKNKNLHAGNMVKQLAKLIKGGGGGQPFYATAGGSDLSGLTAVLDEMKEIFKA